MKQITAKQYGDRHQKSKTWACTELKLAYDYGKKLKDVKKIEKLGRAYVVTLK